MPEKPNGQPEFSLCETFDVGDVEDFYRLALEVSPDSDLQLLGIVHNDSLTVQQKAELVEQAWHNGMVRKFKSLERKDRLEKFADKIAYLGFRIGRVFGLGMDSEYLPWDRDNDN